MPFVVTLARARPPRHSPRSSPLTWRLRGGGRKRQGHARRLPLPLPRRPLSRFGFPLSPAPPESFSFYPWLQQPRSPSPQRAGEGGGLRAKVVPSVHLFSLRHIGGGWEEKGPRLGGLVHAGERGRRSLAHFWSILARGHVNHLSLVHTHRGASAVDVDGREHA